MNIHLQIVEMRSLNMCVQTVDMKNQTGVAFSVKSVKDMRNNLILLTDFNPRNKMQQICYKRMMLMNIRSKVNNHRIIRQLNPDVVKAIQQLRIQKRKRGRRGGGDKAATRNVTGFRYVNFSNLRQVTIKKGIFSEDTFRSWTKFGFGNVQSLKNKENLLRDYLVNENIGLFLATETWLKSDMESHLRIQGSALNIDGYRIAMANRETGFRGGGLALIYKDTLYCKLIEKGLAQTFEYAQFDILGHNMTLSLLALYHPPPSPKHKHTVNEFVSEFVDFLADMLVKFTEDLIIAGDFNIHVNDLLNDDTQQLLSVLEALEFDQLVDSCTHNNGNILELMFTCIGNKIKCINIKSDGFILDHCIIQSQLTLVQNSCCIIQKVSRNFKDMDFGKF